LRYYARGDSSSNRFSDSKYRDDFLTWIYIYFDNKGIKGIRSYYKKGGWAPMHGEKGTGYHRFYFSTTTRDAIYRVSGTSGYIVDSLRIFRRNNGPVVMGNTKGGSGFDTSPTINTKNCRLVYVSGSIKNWEGKNYIGSIVFTFVCCTKGEFSFKVRSTGKMHAGVLLSSSSGGDGHQIVIGGFGNQQSVIRDSRDKPHPGYAVTKTPNILSSSQYNGFWIHLKHDNTKLYVSVGRQYNSRPFMSYALNYKHPINYIAFESWKKPNYYYYERRYYSVSEYKKPYYKQVSNLLV